ncbi:hypothetical protein AVEN_198928-1 [Araneus ventricosus]|uniref:Uncharacterized protein n=1 Tax=Araneus ventricosus TaxID=182803 RepID=A0A4Y2WTA0_ARAVE|nr:hypothetical protein AVEN_198928-1 [Araneus ventricosus]
MDRHGGPPHPELQGSKSWLSHFLWAFNGFKGRECLWSKEGPFSPCWDNTCCGEQELFRSAGPFSLCNPDSDLDKGQPILLYCRSTGHGKVKELKQIKPVSHHVSDLRRLVASSHRDWSQNRYADKATQFRELTDSTLIQSP